MANDVKTFKLQVVIPRDISLRVYCTFTCSWNTIELLACQSFIGGVCYSGVHLEWTLSLGLDTLEDLQFVHYVREGISQVAYAGDFQKRLITYPRYPTYIKRRVIHSLQYYSYCFQSRDH